MKKLVIVESPSKSKTIEKYLGSDYTVVASMGHIRDLATTGKFGLGVDVENDFSPSYIAMKGKSKVISSLKKLAKESDEIYLATDPDREGEAISWHLAYLLDIPPQNLYRITFNEYAAIDREEIYAASLWTVTEDSIFVTFYEDDKRQFALVPLKWVYSMVPYRVKDELES